MRSIVCGKTLTWLKECGDLCWGGGRRPEKIKLRQVRCGTVLVTGEDSSL